LDPLIPMNQPKGRGGCTSKSKRTMKLCNAPAVKGTEKCPSHAGKSLAKAKAEGAVRAEVMAWGLGDATVDPGEVLLRLVTQSAARAEMYANAIAELVDDHDGDLRKALTGDTYTVTEDGDSAKTGEYIRAMARLEAEERDRCAAMATKAIAAGLAERQVRIAERQAAQVLVVMRALAARLGHDPHSTQVTEAIQAELRVLAGGLAA
jgi:hypothetical protein